MTKRKLSDPASVDGLADYVEKLVEGWASVIRCKAVQYGGATRDRIIMVVFRDFYQPLPEDNYCVWDSSRPMLCEDCATDLQLLDLGQ